ncbi:phosphopyruvate hydratase [Cloacibacillus evryensis]|uniref:phosphopyruvate hydratase n=1 Tax=Cloacibacillus evryensis TaxID=508460 RepID=UPI000240D80E|nr:enolase C-terminal domain-like protein [Cloacibacillus evryensis]EHL69312.1 phosphopyruvate hydratase [Synergistes sp. 3_1_syn1]MCQ4764837.1 phosphopyruvate hydratase [Cloacibacillus evryensis]MEA5036519.1 enolase C-terminal domain-like protein [Cloacibacillus evryensis]
MSKIAKVRARQLIDCKCRPMVEVDIVTEKGALGRGSAPTGSSVGMYESYVLRDGDPNEYDGLSVHKAVENVNNIIAPALIGQDIADQAAIDHIMIGLDGTPDKHVLGGNAIYSASIAAFRAAAEEAGMPLYEYIARGPIKSVPIPSFNVINGGRYPGVTQAFNEFIIMPYKADSIYEAVEIAVRVFQRLGTVIKNHTGKAPGVGGSYGWIAPSEDPDAVLSLMQEAIDECGYTKKCAFALDCASSEMYDAKSQTYYLNGQRLSSDEQIDYIKKLTEKRNFVFIEDMLDENDWDGYAKAHQRISRTLIIADDLTATNRERIERAYNANSIDGFILKPNQVGTITEALESHRYAEERGLLSITSGRSGGVIGDVVMDMAVGLGVGFIKNGCPRSGERIDKLNFLMRAASLNDGCVMSDISDMIRF